MKFQDFLPVNEQIVTTYEHWDKKMKHQVTLGRSDSRVFLFVEDKKSTHFTAATHFDYLHVTKYKFPGILIAGIIFLSLWMFLFIVGFASSYGYYYGTNYTMTIALIASIIFFPIGLVCLVKGFRRLHGSELIANAPGMPPIHIVTKSAQEFEKMREFVQKGLPTIF